MTATIGVAAQSGLCVNQPAGSLADRGGDDLLGGNLQEQHLYEVR